MVHTHNDSDDNLSWEVLHVFYLCVRASVCQTKLMAGDEVNKQMVNIPIAISFPALRPINQALADRTQPPLFYWDIDVIWWGVGETEETD